MALLFDLVDRPRKALSYVAEHPKSAWGPALLIIISIVALAVVNLQATASSLSARMAQFASLSPSAQSSVTGSGQTGTRTFNRQGATAGQTPQPGQQGQGAFPAGAPTSFAGFGLLTPVIGIGLLIISWLIIAILGHLLGKLFGGTGRFASTFAVGVWSTFPFFLRDVTQIAFQIITKRTILYQGLSFLAPVGAGIEPSSGILSTLLASFDPFAIWFLVLLGIGLAVVTRIKGWKAALIAVVIFVLLVGVRLLPTLFGLSIRIPILG
jgi:hypothetical protein